MAVAAGAPPESRSASFRNPDRQIGVRADRSGQDRCVASRRKAESQRRAKSNGTYHQSHPHVQVNAPSHRFFKSARREPTIEDGKDNDRPDPQPFMLLNRSLVRCKSKRLPLRKFAPLSSTANERCCRRATFGG